MVQLPVCVLCEGGARALFLHHKGQHVDGDDSLTLLIQTIQAGQGDTATPAHIRDSLTDLMLRQMAESM